MKILSFGAGMQSTALALMACDNANMNKPVLHGSVPIYDAVIFCDLGLEPPWVARQVEFTRCACEQAGIPFYKALPVPKSKRVPRKCSTCADRTCRQRGRACDWKHCKDWKEGPRKA